MNINDYILKEIKALTLQSTVKSAQKICEKLPVSHIPIVENNRLIGCFAESDIQTIENKNRELKEYSYLLHHFYVNEKATVLDLITAFANNDCNIIPVLNEEQNYVGYYELSDILDIFTGSPFLQNESQTLIVEKHKNDYSISEVSQIVEGNNGKLLGVYISSQTENTVEITLKIIIEEINEVIQTFRRYNYTIITKYENDLYLEDLKNRAEYLDKYLNM